MHAPLKMLKKAKFILSGVVLTEVFPKLLFCLLSMYIFFAINYDLLSKIHKY